MNGTAVNLKFLGIGDGLTVGLLAVPPYALPSRNHTDSHDLESQDPLVQYPGYLEYSASTPYV